MTNVYPDFFFKFSSSLKESVKAIGYADSGWGKNALIRTRLLENLDSLVEEIHAKIIVQPICIYLVGGPGNGKTEAAAYFLTELYNGILPSFEDVKGHKYFHHPISDTIDGVVVVEDASELTKDTIRNDVQEYVLRQVKDPKYKNYIYVCCVNRGVLVESASIHDTDCLINQFILGLSDIVSVGGTSPNMWPLTGNLRFNREEFLEHINNVYVWPMDVESLVDENLYGGNIKETPGYKLYENLFKQIDTEKCATCSSKELCPFYENLVTMQSGKGIERVVRSLHSFEIVSGNKILFRDLLSIANVLFVDSEDSYRVPVGDRMVLKSACDWVAYHVKVLEKGREVERLSSAFKLASRQYNQILFGDFSEFSTKDIRKLEKVLRKYASDVMEFGAVLRLIKAIKEVSVNKKNSTRVWNLIHSDFCQKMDVALEEGCDDLEQVEIAFCSSTHIGAKAAIRSGVVSKTLLRLLEELEKCEDGFGNYSFDVSIDKSNTCRHSLQVLQVLGSRMAKREIGCLKSIVYRFDDINLYEKICFSDKPLHEEINRYVKMPLKKVLSIGSSFEAHTLQSIGQTKISPRYVFNISAAGKYKILLKRSDTLPVKLSAPVNPTPMIQIEFTDGVGKGRSVRFPLTFSLFQALCKVRAGLSLASISEQTFVSLNMLSSKLLGIVSHYSDEPRFYFPGGSKFTWQENVLVREEEE